MAAALAALRATSPTDRTTCAWLLARLANFELQRGDATRALAAAEAYPPGLFVRGKALAASGKSDAARDALQRLMQAQATVEGA